VDRRRKTEANMKAKSVNSETKQCFFGYMGSNHKIIFYALRISSNQELNIRFLSVKLLKLLKLQNNRLRLYNAIISGCCFWNYTKHRMHKYTVWEVYIYVVTTVL
jgi:hypothetical protein